MRIKDIFDMLINHTIVLEGVNIISDQIKRFILMLFQFMQNLQFKDFHIKHNNSIHMFLESTTQFFWLLPNNKQSHPNQFYHDHYVINCCPFGWIYGFMANQHVDVD